VFDSILIVNRAYNGAHYLVDFAVAATFSAWLGYTFAIRYTEEPIAAKPVAYQFDFTPFWDGYPGFLLNLRF
jgi:hypothetical protein